MLKNFKELRDVNVEQEGFCETKKDNKGHEFVYLNWAKCLELLYDNGAEEVWFEPLTNEKGSTLFMSEETFQNGKTGLFNRVYEVRVKIKIDDIEFVQNYPLINGSNLITSDKLDQLRVNTAIQRAFVKGVAIKTGLGIGLWIKESQAIEQVSKREDEVQFQDIRKYAEKLGRLISIKMQGWKPEDHKTEEGIPMEMHQALGYESYEEFNAEFNHLWKSLQNLERDVTSL